MKILKILFIGIIFNLISVGLINAGQISRYEIDCTLDVANHALEASQKTAFTNNSDKTINEIYFHIYPHRKYTKKEQEFMYRLAGYFKINPYPDGFQSGDLTIINITNNGKKLSYSIEGNDKTILKVNIPSGLVPGDSVSINIDFRLDIPHSYGRFGWHKDIIALGRWYPILCVLDKEGWHNYPFYPYHQPFFSDSALYKVKITLPESQTVIHTGYLKDSANQGNGSKTLFIETDNPVRDFSLAISPSYKKYSANYKNTVINSFYLPGDEFYGKLAADFSGDLMDNYTNKFGAYPYKEFNIAPVYLGYGGGQTSNMIFIDTRVYKLPRFLTRYFDFLISHETGHQWFYNIVGSDEYTQMWVDEGINSFFILSYLEDKYGYDAKVTTLPKGIEWLVPNFSFRRATTDRYIFLAKNGMDGPILNKLSSFKEPTSIFTLAYGKGAMVLSMLKNLIGDEAFDRTMQRFFKDFRFENIRVEDFIKISQEESQRDLRWFFDQWLLTDKKCDYAIKQVDKDKIIIENLGQIQMPIITSVGFSNGTTKIDSWDGLGKTHTISTGELPKTVAIDSSNILLDLDQTNNVWPRKLNSKFVPFYFFAYEMPLFFDNESYNLVTGPQASEGIGIKSSLQRPFDDIIYTSVGYDFSGKKVKSGFGYEMRHVFDKQMALGFEVFKDEDTDGKEENLDGGKIYLRKELWPASYGLGKINDHITLYIIRNQKFDKPSSTAAREDIEHISYKRNDEAITGATFDIDRSGPYPDPVVGFKFASTVENAGHFLGGTEAFNRATLELSNYFLTFPEQKLATRLKFGWGAPDDKNLFELGSDDGLRGYDRKEIRGSRMLMVNIEYRFPLLNDINYRFIDNIFNFSNLQGVVFFDIGKSWHVDFGDADFKKDAGIGLRFHINLGEFLEKIVVRLDVAQAINEPKEDPHVWLGVNHTF